MTTIGLHWLPDAVEADGADVAAVYVIEEGQVIATLIHGHGRRLLILSFFKYVIRYLVLEAPATLSEI